jgi:hypothetical protein
MKTLEREKEGIKRIIRIQFFTIALIILAGGIIFGINTERWASAFGTVILLLAFISPFAPLTYMAAVNRLNKYSDSQTPQLSERSFDISLTARHLGPFAYRR